MRLYNRNVSGGLTGGDGWMTVMVIWGGGEETLTGRDGGPESAWWDRENGERRLAQ